MTKQTITGHCDAPECGETFASDTGALPDGWRHVRVMEITKRHTVGAWMDLCPTCSEKLDWMMPKEKSPLQVRHESGIGPAGE